MAIISITVPDAVVTRVQDAYDSKFVGRGGLTKTQWVQRQTAKWFEETTKEVEAQAEAEVVYNTKKNSSLGITSGN